MSKMDTQNETVHDKNGYRLLGEPLRKIPQKGSSFYLFLRFSYTFELVGTFSILQESTLGLHFGNSTIVVPTQYHFYCNLVDLVLNSRRGAQRAETDHTAREKNAKSRNNCEKYSLNLASLKCEIRMPPILIVLFQFAEYA